MQYKYVITLNATPAEIAELMERVGESAPRMMRSLIKHVREVRAEIKAAMEKESLDGLESLNNTPDVEN